MISSHDGNGTPDIGNDLRPVYSGQHERLRRNFATFWWEGGLNTRTLGNV